MNTWKLKPGEFLSREFRRQEFGGALYGGIEPSAKTPNVFIYSDPHRGETNGYIYDGWNEDQTVFLYTGEGKKGDQRLTEGNKAIANHKADGRSLRLFVAEGVIEGSRAKNQRYVGEFEIDEELPYYIAEAPDSDNLETRSVFVFRLRPLGAVEKREADLSVKSERPAGPISLLVEPEAVETDVFEHPGSQASTSVRVESGLVKRFRAYLESKGHEVKRWRLAPLGELTYLYTDIFDVTENELYEAKGSVVRSSVRQAVGQLLDYKRLIQLEDVKLSVLLPVKPSIDIQDFIRSCQMSCVWENEIGEFEVLSKE